VRFVVDENLSRALVVALRERGHHVTWVKDAFPATPDTDVAYRSFGDQSVVVTQDRGFGALFVIDGMKTHGLLVVRLPGDDQPRLVSSVLDTISALGDGLYGHITILSETGLRRRPLP